MWTPQISSPADPLPDEARVTVGQIGDLSPEQQAAAEAKASDDAIIKEALDRYQMSDDAESLLRQEMAKDLAFLAGDHWPQDIKNDRLTDGRPCLVVNKLPQYVNQVTNQQRAARPSIQIGPIDSKADIETARIFQGLIRHIEVDSRADLAYDHACQDQVGLGRGWWMITAEYEPGATEGIEAVRQRLAIKRVRNRFRIYPDPTCQEPDYSDALFLHDIVDLPRSTFEGTYGTEVAKQQADWDRMGGSSSPWARKDLVRVSKYWRVSVSRRQLHGLPDGTLIDDRDVPMLVAQMGKPVSELRKTGVLRTIRTITDRTVEWYLMTGAMILERGQWPGPWIPYIPVIGIELDLNGRIDLRGIVRDARDPMQRYDVQISAETEAIGLMPKAPYIGYKGQFTDPKWKDANRRNYPYLESELMDINGERVPLPQRNFGEPAIRAIAESIQQADSDLRTVTGYFDQFPNESVGSERSGRAILARQRQGELGNSHFMDNLARAVTFTGRQLVSLIPHYYDTFQILRILGDDQKPKTVGIFSGPDNAPPPQEVEGIEHVKDLSAGRYDVTVKMGKSYQSSREEQADALTALAQAAPQMVPQFADLWIGSQDWPGAQDISKRLTPPQFQNPDGQPIPPKVQQQMQMLMQQHEQLAKALEAATEDLKTKRLELESKERIAKMQVETQLLIAQLQAGTSASAAEMKHRIDMLSTALDADQLEMDRVTSAHGIARDARDFESAQAPGTPGVPNPSPTAPAPETGPLGPPPGA